MARVGFLGAAAMVWFAAGSAVAADKVDFSETFLPENNLYLQDNIKAPTNITEQDFRDVIAKANAVYQPLIKAFGGTLQINPRWTDSTVNANATQFGSTWQVNMYGGLARRPEVTPDGFAMVLCHEIGHHVAGFPFSSSWAANEGQSDYFATHQCAQAIWKDDTAQNAKARELAPAIVKAKCDDQYQTQDAQNLCYRTMLAGKSLGDLLAALGSDTVKYNTPDTKQVSRTNNNHPAAQCRLDTYMAGALCTQTPEDSVIPGKRSGRGRNDSRAEEESAKYYCTESNQFTVGLRPRCWFKPTL